MTRIILKGFIMVPAEDLAAVKKELVSHIAFTLNEPGCITFKINQSKNDACRFDVYEEFIDRASFDAHQARVKLSIWGKVSAKVKRYYEITE